MTADKKSRSIRWVVQNEGLIPGAALLGGVGAAVVPGVARLLRPAALQLLHQHLAAPSQSVADLPEGAAATQGAVTVLGTTTGRLALHLPDDRSRAPTY